MPQAQILQQIDRTKLNWQILLNRNSKKILTYFRLTFGPKNLILKRLRISEHFYIKEFSSTYTTNKNMGVVFYFLRIFQIKIGL